MTYSLFGALRGAVLLWAAVMAAGCSVPVRSAQLGANPENGHAPPRVTITPAVIEGGGTAVVRVDAPGADSIALESVNGLDRYGTRGSKLSVKLSSRFGEAKAPARYAVQEHGHLFDVIKRPIKITTCWERRICRNATGGRWRSRAVSPRSLPGGRSRPRTNQSCFERP